MPRARLSPKSITHPVRQSPAAQKYAYAREKLYLAVSYAVASAGDARSRLQVVYAHIHVLRAEHLPVKAWRKIRPVLQQLTVKDRETEQWSRLGKGLVFGITRRMRNSTASKLLKSVWDAWELL